MSARWLSFGVLLVLGCAGWSVGRSELEGRPYALHHFDAETLRKRGEMMEDAGRGQGAPAGQVRAPNIEDFARYIGQVLGARPGGPDATGSLDSQLAKRFPGRLVLVDPVSGDKEKVPSLPGALPRAWSPDGRRLLYSQLSGRFRQLFLYDVETETSQMLTTGPEVHPDGCFGPAGRFVFVTVGVRNKLPFSVLELTEPGGIRPVRFTEGPSDFEVACAPDGSAVAWVRVDEKGRDHLMTRSPVADGPIRDLGTGRFPAFSPDSEWIVYSRQVRGRWALQRIRADGSGRRPVGTGTLHEVQPTFSPDGRLVLYVSDNGFEERIYVRRFDGSGDRILLGAGGGTDPIW